MVERISVDDGSLIKGFANHIQRYAFAEQFCSGARVLDAGCGTGYGSSYLAVNGASRVVAVDISEESLVEANRLYRRDNLRFLRGDAEQLTEIQNLERPFDVVVNLENIEHLNNPSAFLSGATQVLSSEGTLVVSSPNGQITERDEAGRIKNPFHVREFTAEEFSALLGRFFASIELFGQWKTPERIARIESERHLFENLCEQYYSPHAGLWRLIRRFAGRKCAPPPQFTAEGTSFSWEFTIKPLQNAPFPWSPDVLLAVCRGPRVAALTGSPPT
jgi:2-polyprenyl-3-methyl-5-hydroxy-6-metoxy-1,4-benzoquinol methylase